MSWEYDRTNPVKEKDMFRTYELYDENKDKFFKYTEAELEIIEKIKKSGSI